MFRNLFKRIKRKRLLKIIKKAKEVYLNGEYSYMCPCFWSVTFTWQNYEDIVKAIPEFKPATFGIDTNPEGMWWGFYDVDSRIKAFDKLIEIYNK